MRKGVASLPSMDADFRFVGLAYCGCNGCIDAEYDWRMEILDAHDPEYWQNVSEDF